MVKKEDKILNTGSDIAVAPVDMPTGNVVTNSEVNPTGKITTGEIPGVTTDNKVNLNSNNLNASEYNKKARNEGREDWATAYRSDVLNLDSNTTSKVSEINTGVNIPKDNIATPKSDVADKKTDFTVDNFKADGSKLTDIESAIEEKYNTIATIQNGKIIANIGGENYEWNIDESGNPIKSKVGGESEQDLFSRMVNGEQFDDTGIKTTQEYKKATDRKANYDKFSGMSESDLSYQLQGGNLLPGTKAYEDLKSTNPDLLQKAENLKSLNSVNNALNGKTTETEGTKTIQDTISDYLISITNPSDLADYKTTLSSDAETINLNNKLTDKDLELTELVDLIDNVEDDIDDELDGALLSKSRKYALTTERTKELARAYKLKLAERDVLAGQLETRATDIKYDIEQAQLAKKDELTNFQTMYSVYQDQLANQSVTSWEKLNDTTLYDPTTGETKDIGSVDTTDTGEWAKLDEMTLYNKATGEFKNLETGETTKSDSPTYTGTTLDFIKEAEGYNNVTYDDATGEVIMPGSTAIGTPTIGYGFTTVNGEPVTAGMEITNNGDIIKDGQVISNVDAELQSQIDAHSNYSDLITIDLTDAQKTALASFEYNLGPNIWSGDGSTIIDAINKGDFTGAGEDMKQYVNAGGEFVQGLANRRQKEADMLMQGASEDNAANFAYAKTLTASGRTEFLKEKGLEDEYIEYSANQGGSEANFSDIQDITDINFPSDVTMFKSQSFGYGNRMDTSTDIISDMEDRYKDSWTSTEYLSPKGEWTPNFLKTGERQQYEQAQRNFINAVLRQESGAAIAPSEFKSAEKQYFPVAGDSDETMDQKRANREQVIENMYRSSGVDDKGRNIVDIYKNFKGNTVDAIDSSNSIKGSSGKTYTW